MYQYQDQKEMRRALNGKMIVMLVGIMLVMTALTSSLSYGIRCWSMDRPGVSEVDIPRVR